MKKVLLNSHEIPYKILKKKNKHTYYYFRKEGYIQIHLSRYQCETDAVYYMKKNARKFVSKMESLRIPKKINKGYYLWGNLIRIIHDAQTQIVVFNPTNNELIVPKDSIDHGNIIRAYEKSLVMEKIQLLYQKHQDNGLINIDGIHYTVRSMKTRYGSCNKVKRRMSINVDLVHFNPQYIEYVYLHEITHLVHCNHAEAFYTLLEQLCPNYKKFKKDLKELW